SRTRASSPMPSRDIMIVASVSRMWGDRSLEPLGLQPADLAPFGGPRGPGVLADRGSWRAGPALAIPPRGGVLPSGAMKTSREMRLLSNDPLLGFGNVGEGMAIQLTRDKRRILWLAHESAPKNVTAVDVTNPKKPSVVVQTDLPHDKMRSNSLDLVGDTLVVAYPTTGVGMKPAGIELSDVWDPAKPKSIGFFDASGPASRGVHHLWFVDGHYIHCAAGAPDFTPRNPKDDQFYRIVDVRNPS